MNYYLRDISPELWRKVRILAASEGISIRKMILDLLEKRTANLKFPQ